MFVSYTSYNFRKSKSIKNICLIILLAVLVSNCKDETVNPPAEIKIYFKGLAETDVNGWQITLDTTDWRTNDTWVKQESDLFKASYQSGCLQSFKNEIVAYPNPGIGFFSLQLSKLASTRVEFRLVDENFKTLISSDTLTTNSICFDVRDFGIKDTLRLYYRFIENNCEFRGHGDILIQ